MSRIRLIGIDLDGTLVMNSHEVSERNIAAIRAATQRGVTVALATGRPHVSAERFAERLGLGDVPIISFNGAIIRRPGEQEAMFEAPVPADLAAAIVEDCVARRRHIHYYLGDTMYVTRMSHWALLYARRTGLVPVTAGDMRRFAGREPIKILVCLGAHEAPDALREEQERYGDRLIVTRSMPEYIEYLSRDAGKGKALAWLAQQMSIPMEQTMGMGDMLNDLELVQMSGLGVAMPHAPDAVKAASKYVAHSGPEGVAEAIETFVLT